VLQERSGEGAIDIHKTEKEKADIVKAVTEMNVNGKV
jgi:phenylpyruvate tautomerase PptA (4-oxalocrotonate tautomerase family)